MMKVMNNTESYESPGSKFSKLEEMSPNSRSFFQRSLGKMEAGAMRGAIFTLISTAIGSGCLTLPLVMDRQGIFLGMFILAFTCLCSFMGILNISNAAENFRCYEYSQLVEKVMGRKWKILFDNTLILYVIGTLIGYQAMIGFFVPSIFQSINISFNPDIEKYIIMVVAAAGIMTPLGLKKSLTSLRFMSIVSVLTILYIALVVIIEFPFFAKYHSYKNIDYFSMNLYFLSSYNICLYTFTCHTNVAQVYDELKDRSLRRIGKVAYRAMLSVLVPFVILALFGYLSTIGDTPNLIIMRKAPRDISNDWLMVIGRIMMSITIVIAVPINIPPCRKIIIKTWLRIEGEPSTLVHTSVTLTLITISLLVGMFYPKVLVVFSILGGYCCGVIVIVIPSIGYLGMLKVKTENYPKNSWKAILYQYGSVFLLLMGTTGAILSVAGLA